MTKSNYELIAGAIADASVKAKSEGERSGIMLARNMIAQALGADSARFDAALFVAACDPKSAEWARAEGIEIVDPDGWDRDSETFEIDFNRPISLSEWERRRNNSTIAPLTGPRL
jgi:hypothetical protein